MFRSVGPIELIIVLAIVIFIFGPKRLPGLGQEPGAGMRKRLEAISGNDGDEDDASRPAREDGGWAEAAAPLGRSEGAHTPLEGEAAAERASR